MRTVLALALLAASAGCGSGRPAPDATLPLDAALRTHLATVDADTPVDVLVGTGQAPPDEARGALEAAGLTVRALSGGVAAAQGVRAAVLRAAALPFVQRVELSQDRTPLLPSPGR